MATTETKPGFRLPWSADRNQDSTSAGQTLDPTVPETAASTQESETPDMIDATTAANVPEADVEAPVSPGSDQPADPAEPAATAERPAETPATESKAAPEPDRKPNKFMADLTKAMHVAAEAAREETLARFTADAKAYIESVHANSATEAAELRQQADDDVAEIRDWSKAEIARIRAETDERISYRKSGLETEIEEHAAAIEARIERVQARVDAFEAEMSAFFERLLAEEEPTRFAAMAETLPEPPPFDGSAPARVSTPSPAAEVAAPVAAPEPTEVEAEVETEVSAEAAAEAAAPEAVDEPASVDPVTDAIQTMTAEAASASDEGDLFSIAAGGDSQAEDDPRLSMLGLTPDFAAAEAEAASASGDGTEEELPEIASDTIEARMAGLVPGTDAATAGTTTRVVVNGLISVASIAGFKRHLSRATGVQSVGVSSGPDGEFVFAVGHGSDVALQDVIATLPGFNARVTDSKDGEITVSAEDPEAQH